MTRTATNCRSVLKLFGAAALGVLIIGCSSERKPVNEKPVVPVSGIIHVDGKPLAGIAIKFHAKVQEDTSHRVFPKGQTDEQGRFKAWTYRRDDGLPPGDYTLTFIDHSKANPMVRNNPDLFKGKYSNPENTEHRVTVPAEGAVDMGTIDLTH